MVYILVSLQTILSVLVFYLISTIYEPDDIITIMSFVGIEDLFMRVIRNMVYAYIYTLNVWNCWCHSFRSEATGCLSNANYAHDNNVLYPFNHIW